MRGVRVLVVDLNNFARYPTIGVGYLAASLRREGADVSVYSPLAVGVPGVEREPSESKVHHLARRLNYVVQHRHDGASSRLRDVLDGLRARWGRRHRELVLEGFDRADPASFDAVLVSAYLMYYDVCVDIGRRCARAGVPLLIGGGYFANEEVARAWLGVPGLTALIGGEVELELPEILHAARGRNGELGRFPGVWLPDGSGGARPPLQSLDAVPFPDYRDFPWHAYPNRIVPMITGRGCAWGACAFCSDVTSTAGRSFRSRSPENVLSEVEMQARRHETSVFAFTDLKLNSDLKVWSALIEHMPERAPGARWIGAVHAGSRQPNGLDDSTLVEARRAGLVRLTTGLESGSQRVLDAMKKGTDLTTSSRFLRGATRAGISVRVTMIHGFPGERAEDVVESARFLEEHVDAIDRVSLNRFQMMLGPSFMRWYDAAPERYPDVKNVTRNPRLATADHEFVPARELGHVAATQRLLSAVHAINRKPLGEDAREFEGVM